MKRYHNRPVTEAVALEALELDALDALELSLQHGATDDDRTAAFDAAAVASAARRGIWPGMSAPAVVAYVPRHRDTVRPCDSYSLAVAPFRAPRHLDSSATLIRPAAATLAGVA